MVRKISVKGHEFTADFDYQPYERPTLEYPGCSEGVDINEIWDANGKRAPEWAFEMLEYEFYEACLDAAHEEIEESELRKYID